MATLESFIEAYNVCKIGKMNTKGAIEYGMDYEHYLYELVKRINARIYEPKPSTCFVVKYPRYREVFAAEYEDRIVHHWIALRTEPMFEMVFSPRTFNCRKGKGQLYGIEILANDIREVSCGYTRDCWIAKLDLQGFFMSINKRKLNTMLDNFFMEHYHFDDLTDLRYLSNIVIMHEPQKNCIKRSPEYMWDYLSKNKSLFTNGEGLGVAIGNLFAQHDANFYLNMLDWYLDTLGIRHGRYVDDFYIVCDNKEYLLSIIPQIRALLSEWGLSLHPKKFYIQHYTKGVEFTGMIVKPHRIYVNNRIIHSFRESVADLNASTTLEEIRLNASRVNSYLGMLKHCNEYTTRRNVLQAIDGRMYQYLHVEGSFESVRINRKYTKEYEMRQLWRNAA